MLIGEVAAATGVSTKTLRFYEREALLPEPDRLPNGYRDYEPAAIGRVAFIRHAQGVGFTLAQIRDILAVRDGGQGPCVHVDALVHQRITDLERRIAELHAMRDTLQHLARRGRQLGSSDGDHAYCHILEGPSHPEDP